MQSRFLYVTYIAATAESVWNALTDAEVTRRWYRVTAAAIPMENLSDWKPGSPWQRRRLDDAGTVDIAGKVLESTPPHHLAVTWARPSTADNSVLKSRLTFEVEPYGEGLVKLSVVHEDLDPDMHRGISGGWPKVMANLKTFLETGQTLPASLWL